jgi:SAM-dependent methyltransferase
LDERQVQAFWAEHPCGEHFVAGADDVGYARFFDEYDRFRYDRESHILDCLDGVDFRGRKVLEIGLGLGADSEQIIRRGARWTGVDLTAESVDRVKTRLQLRGVPYDDVIQGSVLELPFPDNSFDVVFSHGVLHHVPDIAQAQRELARVLRPGGEAVVMLYAKYSLNYLVSVGIVRRLGLIAMYALDRAGLRFASIYGRHVENARRVGLRNYLAMQNFVHRNTDGPENPYSKVYSLADVRRDFPSFSVVRAHKEFMHAPPLPVARLGLARIAGWHLWVHLRPVAPPPRPAAGAHPIGRRARRQPAGRSS